MTDKVLSVSVAAYNAEKDIGRCIDSLVGSSVADRLDIIIVNDGSTDDTREIAEAYEKQYPGIVRVVNKENGGHGSTINAGILAATGKYFRPVDADDWVDREGVEKLVHVLEKTEADLVLNPFHVVDAKTMDRINLVQPFLDEKVPEDVRPGSARTMDETAFLDRVILYMHSVTWRTEVVKRTGPVIDEHCFYVDMEYVLYPLQYAGTWTYFDFPVYQYLVGTSTQSMNRDNLIRRRDQHLRVTKNLIMFYENRKGSFSAGAEVMILHRLRLAVLSQYNIYLNMNPSESREEIKDFSHWVYDHFRELTEKPDSRMLQMIEMNRKTGFVFYPAFVKSLNLLHKTPEM